MSFALAFDRVLQLMEANAPAEEQKAALRVCAAHVERERVALVPMRDVLMQNDVPLRPPALPELLHRRLIAHHVARMDIGAGAMPVELRAYGQALLQPADPASPQLQIPMLPERLAQRISVSNAEAPTWLTRRSGARIADMSYFGAAAEPSAPGAYSPFTAPEGGRTPLRDLFDACEAAKGAAAVKAADALIAHGETALESGRTSDLVELLADALDRERESPSIEAQRAYGAVRRRFRVPAVLNRIARLIPAATDWRPDIIKVLASAEELGANAVIDLLVVAEQRSHRTAYLDALRELPVGVPAVLHMMTDSRWYVLRNAAYLVGELRIASAEPAMLMLSTHADDRVRSAVYTALAKLGTPRALAMLQASVRDPSAALRRMGADALGSLDAARALPTIQRALEMEKEQEVQLALIGALGRLATPAAVKVLAEVSAPPRNFFDRKRKVLRAAAARALAAVGSPEAEEVLGPLRNDRDPDVRTAAIAPLVRRGTMSITPLGIPNV